VACVAPAEPPDRIATLTGTVPLASIVLAFDPVLRFGDYGVRLETLGDAAAILVAVVFAALIAGRTPPDAPHTPAWLRRDELHLRRDDLLFIVLGIVPGAVVAGRLGYVLLHPDFYAATQSAILDPGQGSLELGLGIVGGTLTGAYVGRLLDAPIGRWLHVAAIPFLVVVGLGKLAMLLGGSGQGQPSNLDGAFAFSGPGPWGSLGPSIPSLPSQVIEAAGAGMALLVVLLLVALGGFRARDGSLFFVALLLWAVARGVATLTWRDDPAIGAVRAGTLIAVGIGVFALLGVAVARWAERRARYQAHAMPNAETGPEWPDPDARPQF
jgi:prolipoprotein diacylglyceryltransferase